MLDQIPVTALISHRFAINEAAQAYVLLDQRPEEALQVVLTY
jgi:threonine dehydrogenase-like Zn-dependent dehydrogenase